MPKIRVIAPLLLIGCLFSQGCTFSSALKPLSPGAVILCFGDSLTFGTGAPAGFSYPDELRRMTGYTVVSSGVPGEVTADGLERLPGALDEAAPELLVLCHGANDFLRGMDMDVAARNLAEMVRLARERGVQVVLIGVPRPGILLRVEPFYFKVARATHTPLETRAFPKVLADGSMKSDLIHPNERGYRVVAERVAEFLKRRGAFSGR